MNKFFVSALLSAGIGIGMAGARVVDPGHISASEAQVLLDRWADIELSQRQLEVEAANLSEGLNSSKKDQVEEAWRRMGPIYNTLDLQLDRFALEFYRVWKFDTDEEVEIPSDVENPVVWQIQQARESFSGNSSTLHIQLPAGEVPGFILGKRDRKDEVNCSFLDEVTLVLTGDPRGTTIVPLHNEPGWGVTVSIDTTGEDPWDGRVHLVDVTIVASGANSISTVSKFGASDTRTPYKDVTVRNVRFIDHPDPNVKCVRPVSVNHCAFSAYNCYVDMPNSKEHWIYSRNPYNADTVIDGNTVVAVGGQVLQYVSRPDEGPSYGRSQVTVTNNLFSGYHRWCERASYGITIAGSGQDWLIQDNVVVDTNPSGCFGAGETGGAIVAWDGGRFYEPANRTIQIRRNVIVQENGDRATISLDSAEQAIVVDNAIFGRDSSVSSRVSDFSWSGNNGEDDILRAIETGIDRQFLTVIPNLRRDNIVIGSTTETYSWIQ